MLRFTNLSLVLAICLSGLPSIWQAKQLPRCCTQQHGCTMVKRAAAQCAFATCDREDAITALKMPPGIAPATSVASVPEAEYPIAMLIVAVALPQNATDIDHPPRLLLA